MLACIRSAQLQGLDVIPLVVEVDVASGLPGFSMVGLPDSSVRESRDRVFAALKHTGFEIPSKRITINLAPADHKKEGSSLDLPIALGLLAASGQIHIPDLSQWLVVGELSLDGRLRSVRGTLGLAIYANQKGPLRFLLPAENTWEPHGIQGLQAYGARDMREAIAWLSGQGNLSQGLWPQSKVALPRAVSTLGDFSDIRGQTHAKRAMLVAAAGGHHFVMLGSPGCGKTMMARRLPTLLPDLDSVEALEVRRIYDCAGMPTPMLQGRVDRPFRSPHHTASPQAIIGGGPKLSPGEASLAHHGILFLDEWPEYRRSTLEALRQPLEEGQVHLSRVTSRVRYPCRFQFGAAMNPCPCGFLLDAVRACTCAPEEIARYRRRISGPILDRIDLHIEVPRLGWEQMRGEPAGERSAQLLEKVQRARARQCERYQKWGAWTSHSAWLSNAHISAQQLARSARLGSGCESLLGTAVDGLGLSARAYDRVKRVALTLADLAGEDTIREEHIAEALSWRILDRPLVPDFHGPVHASNSRGMTSSSLE
jgi:magnesium chelatase family protein